MPSTKKYKLHAPAGEGKSGVCAFFLSDKGCRNGTGCKFLHQSGGGGDTMVSSESEGEQEAVPISNSYSSMGAPKKEEQKKRKNSSEPEHNPFAKPKGKVVKREPVVQESTTAKSATKRQNKTERSSFSSLQLPIAPFTVGEALQEKEKLPKASSLKSSLQLPVAPFTVGEAPQEKEKKLPRADSLKRMDSQRSAVTDNEEDQEAEKKREFLRSLPMPTSKEGKKWNDAIKDTRSHFRYLTNYDLEKYKIQDEKAGYASNTWVKTSAENSESKKSNPQTIAIDCEMCETKDPVSGFKDPRALCRVSVVDVATDEVLLDTLVKPVWPVSDYRTWVNGIKEEHLENVQFTLRHAQSFFMALCTPETVLIGHSLHNDLASLRWDHPTNVDSALLFRASDSERATVSLKDVGKTILQVEMPNTHDSVNDARVSMQCCQHYRDKQGEVEAVTRTPKATRDGSKRAPLDAATVACKLLVHRIPKKVRAEHIHDMIQEHTHVVPVEVEPLQANDSGIGKTYVIFASPEHASLAFGTLSGTAMEDTSGKLQKKVHLHSGDYVRVRLMQK